MDIDSRLQDIILPFDKNRIPDIAILGFPFDEGVRRNGGRIGANEGPSCFRKYMRRICSSDAQKGVDLSQLFIQDWGDISPTLSLEEAHEQLTEKISLILNQDACPFIVGGGNDQSYPNSSALLTKCIADNK
jgi:formiminoglutamase